MKVHWTDTAEKHLDAIYSYIAQDSGGALMPKIKTKKKIPKQVRDDKKNRMEPSSHAKPVCERQG